MTVFLSFMLTSAIAGILMRRRPFYQTQLVVLGVTVVASICYFFFGML
jgi:hypothetical protein